MTDSNNPRSSYVETFWLPTIGPTCSDLVGGES